MHPRLQAILVPFVLLSTVGVGHVGAAHADATAQFAAGGFRAPDEADVNGLRFSLIYGENGRMSGFDLGILSLSESQELSGIAMVLGIHKLDDDMTGGATFSLVNLHDGNDTGFNAAFFNKVNDAEKAVDLGFVNVASGTTLVDIGALNLAKESTAQLGFINVATRLKGVQLGFINVAENGFLPVFPFFNFPKR
jgi:hypothetical protein